jgi:uncharacterized protein YjbJ (UPF0337 family)
MNWDRMEGEWKQRRGKAVHHWGKMMNDELAAIAGKYEELVGRLQEKYGIADEQSKRQSAEFNKVVAQLKKANAKLMTLQARQKRTKPALRSLRSTTSSATRRQSPGRG